MCVRHWSLEQSDWNGTQLSKLTNILFCSLYIGVTRWKQGATLRCFGCHPPIFHFPPLFPLVPVLHSLGCLSLWCFYWVRYWLGFGLFCSWFAEIFCPLPFVSCTLRPPSPTSYPLPSFRGVHLLGFVPCVPLPSCCCFAEIFWPFRPVFAPFQVFLWKYLNVSPVPLKISQVCGLFFEILLNPVWPIENISTFAGIFWHSFKGMAILLKILSMWKLY